MHSFYRASSSYRETNPEPTSSPLRNRRSFLSLLHPSQSHDQAQGEKKQQKQVHWAPVIKIPTQFLSPSPLIKPEPEPGPEPKGLFSMPQHPKSTPNPKPILKPPTAIDHEILYKNLWEMVYQARKKAVGTTSTSILPAMGCSMRGSWLRNMRCGRGRIGSRRRHERD